MRRTHWRLTPQAREFYGSLLLTLLLVVVGIGAMGVLG